MIDFDEQVVIVTGAGRGLGRLYALDLAARGASVVVNDLGGTMHGHGADDSIADEVVKEIEVAGGVAVASHDSVATPEGGDAIVQSALDTYGRLDAVVSNAGIFHTAPFDELEVDDWRRMLNVHVDGGFFLSQPAYRVMKAQGYGRFVFIASSAGLFGQPNSAHYAAAKAALMGLTNVIAIEGAEHGILANTMLPFGYSRMVTETIGELPEDSEFLHAIDPQWVVPIVTVPGQQACDVTPSQLLGLRRPLRPRLRRPGRGLAGRAWQAADRRRRCRPPRRGHGDRAVHHPGLHLRRGRGRSCPGWA